MKKISYSILTVFLLYAGFVTAQKTVIRGTVYTPGEKMEFVSLEKFYYHEQRRQIFQHFKEGEVVDPAHLSIETEIELASPMILQLFFKNMFFTPGDTVQVDYYYTKNNGRLADSLAVQAKYPNDLLFYDQLSKNKYGTPPDVRAKRYISDWATYKADIEQFYKSVLSKIKQQAPLFSPAFYNYVTTDMFYSQLQNLAMPVEMGLADIQKLPEHYFEAFERMDFNNDSLLQIPSYCKSLFLYNTLVTYKGNRNKLDLDQYQQLVKTAAARHRGEVKSYVTFNISNWFFKKAQPEVIRAMKGPLDEHILGGVKPKYKTLILENYPFQFASASRTLSAAMLNTTLRDMEGKSSTLGQVIAANKGRLIYIDLWASWCIPCLVDIPNARTTVDSLFKKDIVDVYIAIDPTDGNWQAESRKLGIPKQNVYVVSNDKEWQALSTALNIESIPHSFLLRDTTFLNFDMPRASSNDLFRDELKTQLESVNRKKMQPDAAPPPPPMINRQ